jgi:aspartate 1-decarboxylase
LLIAAKMHAFEKIELYNINNGERFSTYIIKAPKGSGIISLNGAAARRAHVGDHLIICTYGAIDQAKVLGHEPTIVLVGEKNQIKAIKTHYNQ